MEYFNTVTPGNRIEFNRSIERALRFYCRSHLRFYRRIAFAIYTSLNGGRNVLRLPADTSGYIYARPNSRCQPDSKARKIIDSIRGNKDVPPGERRKFD